MSDLSNLSKAELIARLAAAEAKPERKTSMKVGKAGGVSLYGMGRFPITLYASQWVKMLGKADEIRDFIQANVDELVFKTDEDKDSVREATAPAKN